MAFNFHPSVRDPCNVEFTPTKVLILYIHIYIPLVLKVFSSVFVLESITSAETNAKTKKIREKNYNNQVKSELSSLTNNFKQLPLFAKTK